ncbi:LysR family transcriptional regulator [Kribbella sp. NPDC050124]|uniref:LysR family transcriptional regulator n=1 Tax=Kribbella sp. NPDC050124 TaxID=3364114 RepID=UPI0037AFB09E
MTNPEHLDLNLLRPLQVLLETRNVTRASERLHLSQSATSAVLRRLRHALDDPLLVRVGRDLVLTPYAESLLEPVREILRQVGEIAQWRPEFDPAGAHRTFSIMASDYAAHVVGPRLIDAVDRTAPSCGFEFRELRDDYRQVLRRDEVDVLLISSRLHAHDLSDYPSMLLFTDRFRLCGSAENEALRAGASVAEFECLPYVEYGPGGLRGLADRALQAEGVNPGVEVRTDSQMLVPQLIRGTRLVAHVPERLLLGHSGDGLQSVDPVVPLPRIEQYATWHPNRAVDAGHQWLLSLLRNLIG